ncbi:hypothetical protein R0J89_09320 [Psychrobacter sp. SIMBA_152]
MTARTEEEMTALAAELLEIDLGLPSVCKTCGSELDKESDK